MRGWTSRIALAKEAEGREFKRDKLIVSKGARKMRLEKRP